MRIHPRMLWAAFIRVLIGLLLIVLFISLYLALNPNALGAMLIYWPGHVTLPELGPVPPPPLISAPAGEIPVGLVAFSGEYGGQSFACGFLLQLENGRRVGLSTAHAAPAIKPGASPVFLAPDGALAAHLNGQIKRGRIFRQDHFTTDYVLWSVAGDLPSEMFLTPDPRGQGQPGERVLVFGRFMTADGSSRSWPGVVMKVSPEATWIQLEETINPNGFSGCPVVSQHTGQVIGMAVAGSRKAPTLMGLNPIGSLVKKARAALEE